MKFLKNIFIGLASLIVVFGLVIFVNAARSQYGYIGIYNSSDITLSDDEGAALAVDVNGYLQISDSSILDSLTIGTLTTSSTLIIHSITSTITIGTTSVSHGCLKMQDTDESGWTYCTVLNGVMGCTSTPC